MFAAPDEELADSLLGSDLLEWFLGIGDGERDQDGARPRGNFVDVEPEPVGKQDDFRRDGGDGIVFVLAEGAEVDFCESVTCSYAAMCKNPFPRLSHDGVVGRAPHEFGSEVALDGQADVARASWKERP